MVEPSSFPADLATLADEFMVKFQRWHPQALVYTCSPRLKTLSSTRAALVRPAGNLLNVVGIDGVMHKMKEALRRYRQRHFYRVYKV